MKIVVLGGGPGGYSAALYAAKKNHTVLLIEKDKIGGTCLHRGCIPTKSFLNDSKIISNTFYAKESGLLENVCQFNPEIIVQNKNKIVANLNQGLEKLILNHKIEIINDEASFVDEHSIYLKNSNQTIQADAFIIATGSIPKKLPFVELSDKIWTSDQCFDTVPNKTENIIIIGGGVIGLELATFYRQLQHNVTIIEAEKTCAPNFDSQVISQLVGLLKKSGVTILTQAQVQSIDEHECVVALKDSTTRLSFDHCIMAVGRKPNIDSLSLEKANIKSGFGIEINENYQTSQPHIYAIGDVTGKSWLAHQASAMAKAVISHLLDNQPVTLSSIPMVIYTTPEIAMVGKSLDSIKDNPDYRSVKVPLLGNGMHMISKHQRGFMSMIINKNDIIEGATVFSSAASEIIHTLSIAIDHKLSIHDLSSMVFAHPSLSEPISDLVNEPLHQAVHSLYRNID